MKLKAFAMAMLACSSMLANAQINTSAASYKQAGMYETNDCRVPQAITVAREISYAGNWPILATNRYVQFAGEPAYLMIGPTMAITGKNPEQVYNHGPAHYTNCTNGQPYSQTQFMVFKMKAAGYFNTTVGGHLAVLMRAAFSGMTTVGTERYQGLGVTFAPSWGILGERYRHPEGAKMENNWNMLFPDVPMIDGHTYEVTIHAAPTGVAYRVVDLNTGKIAPSGGGLHYFPGAPLPDLYSTGVGFAVICKDPNGNCPDNGSAFRIDFWDINSGWFTP